MKGHEEVITQPVSSAVGDDLPEDPSAVKTLDSAATAAALCEPAPGRDCDCGLFGVDNGLS